jgi:signal transduction histidine kinase
MKKRIILSVILSIFIILVSLGIISYISVNDSIQRSLESRLTLANIIGKYIDHMLESNLTRLHDISISGRIDFDDEDWEPEKRAIKTAYEYSIFTERIFLLDMQGNVVLMYPHQDSGNINLLSIPHIGKTISEQRPFISDVYTVEPIKRKVIFALVPLKDKNGEVIGIAGGEMNPTHYAFIQILKSIPAGPDTVIELIDSHGMIISSNHPQRILTSTDHNKFLGNLIADKKSSVGTCHRCHLEQNAWEERTEDMLAFAPLTMASWGITVREPQEVVFAPSTLLLKGFFSLSLIAVLTALILAVGLSRSIVRPIQLLSRAAKRIGKGDLTESIEVVSTDEIGSLADSFDNMRVKLADSLNSIQRQNIELEERVAKRTKDLAESREKLSTLLKKVMTAEEEERKRIARELHDETSQSLNAFLISLDALSQTVEKNDPARTKLKQLREHCVLALQGLHQMIKDLRPPVLDDLGLESAIRWVIERHLGGQNIHCVLNTLNTCQEMQSGIPRTLDCAKIELLLFRVIQEAIINIAKHAHAENVFVCVQYHASHVSLDIEDDGRGFDVEKACSTTRHHEMIGGFGILGMQERIALLDGNITICSRPNEGTQISAFVPLS